MSRVNAGKTGSEQVEQYINDHWAELENEFGKRIFGAPTRHNALMAKKEE